MKVNFQNQLLDKMGTEETFNSKPNYVDLVNLIRSIQRAEGNIDCYRSGSRECDRLDCVWRDHCLEKPEKPSPECPSKVNESHEHKKAANPIYFH